MNRPDAAGAEAHDPGDAGPGVIVLDANIFIKILAPGGREEPGSRRAIALWEVIREDRIRVLQPPHWLAELGGVLARLSPSTARDDLRDLLAMELPVAGDRAMYERALEMSHRLGHSIFDTLYHAVALSREKGLLITADRRYYEKAAPEGHIMLLDELPEF